MKSRTKHSGRIEIRPALKTIDGIRRTIRSIWVSACKYDKIDPKEKFVIFSKKNPFVSFYEIAMKEYRQTISEYQSGGYVGLSIQ